MKKILIIKKNIEYLILSNNIKKLRILFQDIIISYMTKTLLKIFKLYKSSNN